jgi:DNA-binding MarR family transcriptional regulator
MSRNSRSKKQQKFQKINLKPVHPIATFTPTRKRLDLLKNFEICFADLFPPGVRLTANEFKVLFVLRGAAIGSSNLAAIDQEKIAEISGIRQPHVARAINGLRRTGLVTRTWMEAGLKMYRNIYALWVPPELLERDAEAMLEQRKKARALERKAEALDEKDKLKKAARVRQKAQAVREKTCPDCGGEGAVLVYRPKEGREKARWCRCSLGRKKAQEAGYSVTGFIPDESTANNLHV